MNKILLDHGCYASYYRIGSNSYIGIEDQTDLVLLKPAEALSLLKWLQEQQSNLEELQKQEAAQ